MHIRKNKSIQRRDYIPKKINYILYRGDIEFWIYLEIILNNKAKRIGRVINGNEAIEYMKSNGDVDLVLMDAKMPVMDGYAATKEIRKFNKDVIIIAQTAYALKGDKEKPISLSTNLV